MNRAPLLAAIAAIAIVGAGLSLTIPYIALRMEAAGYSAGANGASTAVAGLAVFFASPLAPVVARRLGIGNTLLAAAALGALALLALASTNNVGAWTAIRFFYSCALSALFVLSEYAITAMAPDDSRGFWVGVYSTALGLGFAVGPALLGLTGTDTPLALYIGVGLHVLALAPILLARNAIPGFSDAPTPRSASLFARAPTLMLAALVFGVVEAGGMGLTPVHAMRNGYDARNAALLVTLIALSNAVFQIPIGLVADRTDKRRLMRIIAAAGALLSLALAFSAASPAFAPLLFVWAGLLGGLYMVGLAELGDVYDGAELAAANAAFIMLYALGMLLGPPLLGAAIDASPAHGMFGALAGLLAAYVMALRIFPR
ncbi:MAG: MFS transporter [Hyphomicrobiales bacterium]|nr:MFS transporter [Hyphomicrobiales bacterium]